MAAELIWSSESLDDIDAIAEFIARNSPHHAQRVVAALCSTWVTPLPRIHWPAESSQNFMITPCANVFCTAIA